DGKRNREAEEQQHLDQRGGILRLGDQIGQEEGPVVHAEVQNCQQHQQRSGHRVEKELDGGVLAARPAPNADQEVHRDEGEFPEDVEQEQIEREEYAEHPRLKNEQEGVVFLDAILNSRERREDRNRREQGGQ